MSFNRLEHQGGAIQTTLASDIASGDTTLALVAATNWPTGSGGPFYLVVYALNNGVRTNEEKLLATSRSTTTLSGLTRGVDGTAAVAHTAGEIIEHIFTATEADEANAIVSATLGSVTTKGDLTPASGTGTLGLLHAGSNGLPLVTDNAQTAGLAWAQLGAAGIAADAVTNTKIQDEAVSNTKLADNAITEVKFSSDFWHRDTFSVTSGGVGDSTIPHGASFTPSAVFIMFTHPVAAPNNPGGYVVLSIDATNVTVKVVAPASTPSGVLASGQTLAGTILSLA